MEEPLELAPGVPFAKRGRFTDNSYLQRFGFIGVEKSQATRWTCRSALPFRRFRRIDGLSAKGHRLGLTCAACHTGQLVFGGKRYVVDGGPAMTDLGQLTSALGAALGQTAVSQKLPLFDGRFDRFARAVLAPSTATPRETSWRTISFASSRRWPASRGSP